MLFLALLLVSFQPFSQDKHKEDKPLRNDGPYISYQADGMHLTTVVNGKITSKAYSNGSAPKSISVTSNDGSREFSVSLAPIEAPTSSYALPNETLVLSDPHGDLESFVSILKAANVVNDKLEWTYGKNHLVIIGDVFDRGDDVIPIFWLCYKLDYEAKRAGGVLHYLIGNHEDMVLAGDYRYTEEKYLQLAQSLGIEHKQLFQPNTELGRWIRSKNYIETIGPYLFTHAGLSKDFLERNVTVEQVNATMRPFLGASKKNIKNDSLALFLFDRSGPIWYRGMVVNEPKYNPIDEPTLDALLAKYRVKKIIVGHTIHDEVTAFHHGKVVGVNVKNHHNREKGKSRGLVISAKGVELVYDNGSRKPL